MRVRDTLRVMTPTQLQQDKAGGEGVCRWGAIRVAAEEREHQATDPGLLKNV